MVSRQIQTARRVVRGRRSAAAGIRAAGLVLTLAAGAAPAAARTITQAELLTRLVDLDWLTRAPAPGERSGAVYCPARDEAGEPAWARLARIEGAGVLTRIWAESAEGEIRFVLDGSEVLTASLKDFFAGAVEPFGEPLTYRLSNDGGGVSYFPIGFSSSCELHGRLRGAFQVDYTTFDPADSVEPFRPQLSPPAAEALEEVARQLTEGIRERDLHKRYRLIPIASQQELRRDQALTETVEGAGTIRALHISITDRFEPREPYALHKCVLRIYFDGQQQPAVEAPLAAFFGAGFERYAVSGLAAGTNRWSELPSGNPLESWLMYCLWPMPFSDGARIELVNHNRRQIGFLLYLLVERGEVRPRTLRFHARFRREYPWRGGDFTALQAGGRGRFVGWTLLTDTPTTAWWGAGGVAFELDGRQEPVVIRDLAAVLGNQAPLVPLARALHGTGRAAPYGKSAAYRWFTADSVSFQRSIRVALRRPDAAAADTYIGGVAYWYAERGSQDRSGRLEADALAVPPLRIPGAVEIEGAIPGEGWGNVLAQRHAGPVELSGEAAASIMTTQPVRITLTCERGGRYLLKLRVHPTRSFQTIEVRGPAGELLGTVPYRRTEDGIHTVGEVRLDAGENVLTVTCSRSTILDCWILEPLGD